MDEDFKTVKVRVGVLDMIITMDVTNTGFDDFQNRVLEVYPNLTENEIFKISISHMAKRGFKGGFESVPIIDKLFSGSTEVNYNNMIGFADVSALQKDFKTAEKVYNKAIEEFLCFAQNTYLHFLLACLYCKRFAEFDYYMEGKTILLDQDGLLRSIYDWSLSETKDRESFTKILREYDRYIPDNTMILSFLSGIKEEP